MKHAIFKIYVLNYLWLYNFMFNNDDCSSCWSLLSETWMIRLKNFLMGQVSSEIVLPLSSVICQMFLCYCSSWEGDSAYLLLWFASVPLIVLPECSAAVLPLLTPSAYLSLFPDNFCYLSTSYLQLHLLTFASFVHTRC